jgi:type II secretory pathway component PulF
MVHELLLNDTVVYEGQQSSAANNSDSNSASFTFLNGFSGILPMVIVIVIAIIVALFLIRRRTKKREEKKSNTIITRVPSLSDSNTKSEVTNKDSDIFLDDEPTSK